MKTTYAQQAADPSTPSATLEAIYNLTNSKKIRVLIAQNPNINIATLQCAINDSAYIEENIALDMLLLENPTFLKDLDTNYFHISAINKNFIDKVLPLFCQKEYAGNFIIKCRRILSLENLLYIYNAFDTYSWYHYQDSILNLPENELIDVLTTKQYLFRVDKELFKCAASRKHKTSALRLLELWLQYGKMEYKQDEMFKEIVATVIKHNPSRAYLNKWIKANANFLKFKEAL